MIVNTHIHTFITSDIPDKFLPLGLVRWIAKRDHPIAKWILHNIIFWTDNDIIDKYLQFIRIGKLGSQEAIFEECLSNYPKGTKFCVLTMDMAYMGAGSIPRPYEQQLVELFNLKKQYPEQILPFIHIDCRREGFNKLFKQAVEEWGFNGLKAYPPLGVFPYDPRYNQIYEYCQKKNIPIIAHCTDGNPVHWKGSHKELVKLLEGCKLPIDWNKSDKELCSLFTHPFGWGYVMKAFPHLKVSLAHFGRGTEWDKHILDMMELYPNLYVDISYSMYNPESWAPLKVNLLTNPILKTRCMFGSDWWMNSVECSEKQFSINFRCFLGEELWEQITNINTKQFLNLT